MFYNLVLIAGSLIARIIGIFDKKTARFFSLRDKEINRVAQFFNNNKIGRVIWFHAASAGEFEQVKPIIEDINKNLKDAIIVCSFFSPSGYEAGLKYDKIDFCFNLPLDFRKNAVKLLDNIKPYIIIYTKYDVWKKLTVEAYRRGIKLLLINGTLPGKSLRYIFPVNLFFGPVYRLLFKIYSISEIDASRFIKMMGNNDNVVVAGDSRFDRVKTVVDNARLKSHSILSKERGCVYLLAGSTYNVSEKILISVLKQLNDNGNRIKLILVPHEIDPANIHRIKKLINSSGFSYACYSEADLPVSLNDKEVLLVDSFGVLAFLYYEAEIVFIGGSFKGSVHSVLEPAIFGKPIITGPYIDNSYEALALKDIGGLKACKSMDDMYKEIVSLIRDNKYRIEISKKVLNFFNSNLGASKLILKDLYEIL